MTGWKIIFGWFWKRDFDYIDWVRNNKGKALLMGIIIAGLSVFVFNLFFLPETSFQDAIFYLNLTKNVMEGGTLLYPFPVKFYLTAVFFTITGLPIEQFSKLVPFLISLFYFVLLYKISRQLFKVHWLFPLAFALSCYWILNFFTINYNGPLVALFVLAFCYLYLIESKDARGAGEVE